MIKEFWTSIVKQFRRLFKIQPPVPAADAEALKTLHDVTVQSLLMYATVATKYTKTIAEAKTNHKRDLYERKFNKIKPKFQDELARLLQIEQIMKDNKIKLEKSSNVKLQEILDTAEEAERIKRGIKK